MKSTVKQTSLTSKKGQNLAVFHWAPAAPKGVVVFTHGLAGYAVRYEQLALTLRANGLAMIGIDLTGHGHSEGMRGYIDDFQDYVDDYGLAVDYASSIYPGIPLFSFGHSMGATVSAHYVLQNQERFTGSIFMGIAMYVTDSVPKILVAASKFVSRFWPTLAAAKLDSSLVSTKAEKVEEYRKDPLIYSGRIRARTGYTFMMHAEALKSKVKNLQLPLLILHGEKDGLCNPEGSRHLYKKSTSLDKLINIYPDLYHELLNEQKAVEIIQEINDWIIKRT